MSKLFNDVKKILKDREKQYGDSWEMFCDIATVWDVIFPEEYLIDNPEKVALAMIAMKLVREINTPKYDNVVDMAGYLKLYCDMIYDSPATPPPSGDTA